MFSYTPAPARRTHRKRISALRLSSDTSATLPEYIPPSNWIHRPDSSTPSDLPPDYSDSAEEADEDTDADGDTVVYSPTKQSSRASRSPKRPRRHRRKLSASPPSTDSYLDLLLERSVHALELSNTLLQSSMSTPSTSHPSTSIASDPRPSTSRLPHVDEVWADDLEDVKRDVERLFEAHDSRRHSGHSLRSEGSISTSLPTSSSMSKHYRRRPSLDLKNASASTSGSPQLRLQPAGRAQLIAPAPRAMTLYVASDTDLNTICLPSTLGLRSAPSAYPTISRPPPQPPTRAYNMLSSLVNNGAGPSSNSSPRSSRSSFLSGRSSSTSRERDANSMNSKRIKSKSKSMPIRSRSHTPKPLSITTIEECSPPSSSSSSDEIHAKLTVKSLRKILDDQPLPPSPPFVPLSHRFPITPANPPEASASTATASISRLFTKGTHSSSARPPSPPRQGVLKTPLNSTPSSSGRSTPAAKRISFAELPEAHLSTTGKFKDKDKKGSAKKKGKGKWKGNSKEEVESGWWSWLASGLAGSNEERFEERMQRGWGGPSGRMDDWTI